MIDAPCGAMAWMPLLLKNLSVKFDKKFSYFGIDIVQSIINTSIHRYSNYSDQWKFSVLDFSEQKLPDNYDLIFSRDALMHLSFKRIINALKLFSSVKGAKYLLVSSYVKKIDRNENIIDGDGFQFDAIKPPFNLVNYTAIYSEDIQDDPKYLVLYDIPNYLSKVDFHKMHLDAKSHKFY